MARCTNKAESQRLSKPVGTARYLSSVPFAWLAGPMEGDKALYAWVEVHYKRVCSLARVSPATPRLPPTPFKWRVASTVARVVACTSALTAGLREMVFLLCRGSNTGQVRRWLQYRDTPNTVMWYWFARNPTSCTHSYHRPRHNLYLLTSYIIILWS